MMAALRNALKSELGQTLGAVAIVAGFYAVPFGVAAHDARQYGTRVVDDRQVGFNPADPDHIILGMPGLSRTTFWDDNHDGTLDRGRYFMVFPRRGAISMTYTPETHPERLTDANELYARILQNGG